MNNKEIRFLLFEKNIKYYQIAEKLGISACHFSRMLQTELSQERKEKIINAINNYN